MTFSCRYLRGDLRRCWRGASSIVALASFFHGNRRDRNEMAWNCIRGDRKQRWGDAPILGEAKT
jgi:hypothetical protein